MEKVQQHEELSEGNEDLMAEIVAMLERMAVTNAPAAPAAAQQIPVEETAAEIPAPEAEESAGPENEVPENDASETGEENTFHLHIHFVPDCQMENIRAFMVLTKMETIGRVLATIPETLNNNPDASSIIAANGFFLSIATSCDQKTTKATALGNMSVDTCSFIDALRLQPPILFQILPHPQAILLPQPQLLRQRQRRNHPRPGRRQMILPKQLIKETISPSRI